MCEVCNTVFEIMVHNLHASDIGLLLDDGNPLDTPQVQEQHC